MYGCNGKWTVWFGDSLVDMLWTNSYSTYRSIYASDKRVRRHGQYKFVTRVLEEGLQWAFDALKSKKKSPFELPTEDMLELNEEDHLNYKTIHMMKNLNRTSLSQKLRCMSINDPKFSVLLKKVKKMIHYHQKHCELQDVVSRQPRSGVDVMNLCALTLPVGTVTMITCILVERIYQGFLGQ
eukprot:10714595-Ditylum_brightwellii.AAC.1